MAFRPPSRILLCCGPTHLQGVLQLEDRAAMYQRRLFRMVRPALSLGREVWLAGSRQVMLRSSEADDTMRDTSTHSIYLDIPRYTSSVLSYFCFLTVLFLTNGACHLVDSCDLLLFSCVARLEPTALCIHIISCIHNQSPVFQMLFAAAAASHNWVSRLWCRHLCHDNKATPPASTMQVYMSRPRPQPGISCTAHMSSLELISVGCLLSPSTSCRPDMCLTAEVSGPVAGMAAGSGIMPQE